jgi:hypothetical protein
MLKEAPEVQQQPEITDYERVYSLPPVSKMSREEKLTEIAKSLDNPEHPIHIPHHHFNQRALYRKDELYSGAYPPKTPEEIKAEQENIERESQERKQNFETEAAEKKRGEAERTLEMTWGKDWQKNVAQIHELVDDLGTVSLQDVQKIIASPQLGNDHEFIEALHIVTQKMRGAGFKRGR